MSFATRLVLLSLLLVAFTAATIGAVAYLGGYGFMKHHLEAHLRSEAEHSIRTVDEFLRERYLDLALIASSPLFCEPAPDRRRLRERLVEFRNLSGLYASLSFYTGDGRHLADSSGFARGELRPRDALWQAAQEHGRAIAVQYQPSHREHLLLLAAPTRCSGRREAGMVILRLPLPRLHYLFSHSVHDDVLGTDLLHIDLFDRDGLLLYSNHDRPGILERRIDPARVGSDPELIEILAREPRYHRFIDTGWRLLVSVPREEAYAFADHLGRGIALVSLVVGLAASLLALLLGRRLVRPLTALVAATRTLRDGSLDVAVEVMGNDEIGQLGSSFNAMTAAIRSREGELRKLQRAVEESPAAVVITDRNGVIEYVNPQFTRVTGYTRDEVVGGRPNLLKSGKTPPEVYRELWHAITTGGSWHGELLNRTKEGRLFWELAQISPIFERGEITHFVAVKSDISERKKMEQALRRAKEAAEAGSRAKSEFLAVMSHEIRTPMNAVIGMAELLAETSLDDEQQDYLKTQRRAADSLLALIDDILDLTRVESGKMPLRPEPFHLAGLLEELADSVRPLVERKGLAFRIELDPALPERLYGDAKRLHQILFNLAANAVKFTSAGEVVVSVAPRQGGYRFVVRDTGIGIPPERQEEIFRPFTQVDSSLTRKYGGTGLGLAIVRQLVEALGGRVELESVPGRGSTFSFTIPLEGAATEAGEASAIVAEAPPRPLSLLLAEDSDDNAALIDAYLKRSGHRLEWVRDGHEAVERFAVGRYDLVLMDIQMPVMDGYRATAAIRELEFAEGRRHTPVLALTAHAMEGDADKSLAAGCDAHLTKPIKKGQLLEALARFAAPGA